MQHGKPSRTALRVAIRRAAHQLVDRPPVLDDPIALRLIGSGYERDLERAAHTVARDFRCFMAARSRYAEDHVAQAVPRGVRQYVDPRRGPRHLRLSQPVSATPRLRGRLSRHPGVEALDAG